MGRRVPWPSQKSAREAAIGASAEGRPEGVEQETQDLDYGRVSVGKPLKEFPHDRIVGRRCAALLIGSAHDDHAGSVGKRGVGFWRRAPALPERAARVSLHDRALRGARRWCRGALSRDILGRAPPGCGWPATEISDAPWPYRPGTDGVDGGASGSTSPAAASRSTASCDSRRSAPLDSTKRMSSSSVRGSCVISPKKSPSPGRTP